MAEEKKKRRGRRAYLDDFHALSNGEFVYTGKIYAYSGAKPWSRALTPLWILALLIAACLIGSGFLPASGMMGSFYVLIPWVLTFCGGASIVWALCRMTQKGPELKEYVYRATVEALPLRSVFTAVCAGVTGLAQIVRLIAGSDSMTADAVFILLMAVTVNLALLIRPRIKSTSFALK